MIIMQQNMFLQLTCLSSDEQCIISVARRTPDDRER